MKLLKYNNKRVIITTKSGNIYKGMAYYCNADDYEEVEDELSIKLENSKGYFGVFESEIDAIEII